MKYLNPRKMLNFKERKPVVDEYENLPRMKKSLGQHFLRNAAVVDRMIDNVKIPPETTIVEIGCGDGFLTDAILKQSKCKQLIVYEIDSEWADFVKNKIKDTRLKINIDNILDVDLALGLENSKPLVLLANLPYQITFPILFKLQKNKSIFDEGVVMVQEEVAQKIVAKRGKKYSATTLFLQYHFDWKLLDKIEPGSFVPAPKVFSRTLYFKPKFDLVAIPQETEFWEFVKMCFKSPRQTVRNNLKGTKYFKNEKITSDVLQLRAQQISFDQFLSLWNDLIS
jgi:16S rRNA (adenine1518-N6/adenine1519-N6)-dimethyltransferase